MNEGSKAFEFVEWVEKQTDLSREKLASGFQDILAGLGATGDFMLLNRKIGGSHFMIEMTSAPLKFIKKYADGGLLKLPLLLNEMEPAPYWWNSDSRLTALAADSPFGMNPAFVIPILTPPETFWILSIAGNPTDLPRNVTSALHLVGLYTVAALGRITAAVDHPILSRPILSRREREVLVLVSHGKTNFEIAAILGIPQDNADRLFSAVRQKIKISSLGRFYEPSRPPVGSRGAFIH